MRHATSLLLKATMGTAFLLACASMGLAAGPGRSFGAAPRQFMRSMGAPLVQSYGYPGYGYGYSSPFVSVPSLSPPYPYMPKYWWTGPYSTEDPRQSGYNPSAGYSWDSVTTLFVSTSPLKANVTLDGNPIGSADDLGPIQLPMGEHTLRVEAPGYEPSETVMKVQTTSVQRLQINLKSSGPAVAAATPR
jgi:PEGA domain